jgi:adenylate cyclase
MRNQQRHLAAILFTDIVGYTSLMQRNEEQAATAIKRHNAVLQATAAAHNGEVLNFYGDGCLCIFPSATEAVSCALEVQKQLQIPPVVPLRIGLHIGEVFFEEGKVLGDGVNIASRIQSLGQGNTVLFSSEIRDMIKNHPHFVSVSLGPFAFQNVDEPVEVYALANEGLHVPKRQDLSGKLRPAPKKSPARTKWIAAAAVVVLIIVALVIWGPFQKETSFTGTQKSIAVMPFVNISNDTEQNYLSDGVTEEIITQLSKIADLKVIARSTSMLYRHSRKPVRQIARELSVSSILEGSVRRSGNQIRITAQLIDAATQKYIWTEQYDRGNLNDLFSIQSDVAQKIAHELNARLSEEEKRQIEQKPTNNAVAYDLFLRAHYAYNIGTLEGFLSAEQLLKEAIKKDPGFRLAYSYLATVYISLITWAGNLTPAAGTQKAMAVLNQVLQNDTTYLDFTTLALIEFQVRKNFQKSEYYFQRSIRLNPKDDLAYILYAIQLTIQGRFDEAFVQVDNARALSPMNALEHTQRGETHYASGNYDAAINTYLNAIKLFPAVAMLYDDLGRAYIARGQYREAIDALNTALKVSAGRQPSTLAFLSIAHFKTNDSKKADALMEELKQQTVRGEKGVYVFMAMYYSAINQKEEAFHYLDQAWKSNDVDLIWLKVEPSFRNLHTDPRYAVYLNRVGFR